MVMNVRLAINSYINLPYSVPCFLNERFIHSTMLYCLPAFHVIHEKETFKSNKLFKKNICHNIDISTASLKMYHYI